MTEPLKFKVRVGGKWVTIKVEDAEPSAAPEEMRLMEQSIMDAAGATPVPSKALARKAGVKYGPRFRQAIADLCRAGKLKRTPDGICRA